MLRIVRRALDTLYRVGGVIGAAFLITILGLIVAQMISRWTGQVFPGGTDYAGYSMAGASFMSLAYAMNRGAHIRVNLVLSSMGRWRRYAELWCYGVAALTAVFFARYAIKTNIGSAKWNDISQGLDATPLWVPQILMSVGTVMLAVTLIDHFFRILTTEHEGVEGEDDWPAAPSPPWTRWMMVAIFGVVVAAVVFSAKGFEASVFMKTALFLFILFFLLGSGIWVALALMGVAYVGMVAFTSRPAGDAMLTTIWTTSSSWTLTALPLFIWMGEILFRTRLSEDMFKGLSPWLARLPGGLLHTNVVGCTIFAAVSGSSAATLMTVGKMSIPELRKRNYPEFMTIGTLAGSATLGLMIPPSLTLIVYGVTINESISKLFIAGILPGLVLALMFMGYIVAWHYARPDQRPDPEPVMSFGEKMWNSRFLIPVIMLVLTVIGSMYLGFATPTEAAAIGVIGALVLAAAQGSLNWSTFSESMMGAVATSAMVAFILMGAAFLSLSMGFTGLPRALAEWIASLDLSVFTLIAALTLFYIVIGMFLDGISAVVLTMAVIEPMVNIPAFREVGFSMIWFGIFVTVVVEMAQITPPIGFNLFVLTPPIGFNLFVLQGMTRHQMSYIAKTALPMFLIMVLMVAVVVAWQELATWLPETARQGPGG
jgi:tripartite ATP-independent transporter DctM subunit